MLNSPYKYYYDPLAHNSYCLVNLGTKEVKPGLFQVICFYERKEWGQPHVRKGTDEDWDYYVWNTFLEEEVFNV